MKNNNILNSLIKNNITNSIKVNDKINLTIDNSDMTVSKLGFTISKTKKIELIRNYENDKFLIKGRLLQIYKEK